MEEEWKTVMPVFGWCGKNKPPMPIGFYRDEFLRVVRDYQVIIIAGHAFEIPTQIPQFLYQDGSYTQHGKLIACTQPSTIAANTVAARVSKDLMMTHDQMANSIRIMPDSMLLHEFRHRENEDDNHDHFLLLSNYSVIIIDQAHQRTLTIDILLGLLKSLAPSRPDLKLIITTSMVTLDPDKLIYYFDYAPLFLIPEGSNPVEVHYSKDPLDADDYLNDAILMTLQIHVTQPPLDGDILVFLPGGREELKSAKEQILSLSGTNNEQLIIICTSIYDEYDSKLFHQPTPQGARKVFLVTDYADTWLISSTIYGMSTIKYVIDSGLCKHKLFDPHTGIESLRVVPISKASAKDRAGAAALFGQTTAPLGKCFRLYTRHHYSQELEDFTLPEIQRTNLANMVLILKTLGIDDLLSFNFMDRPPRESLNKALDLLYALGALDRLGQLTQVGRRMAGLYPIVDNPMLSKMIVASDHYNCSEEIITIAAMLISVGSDDSIFYCPEGKEIQADRAWMRFHEGNVGDHIALLKIYNGWRLCDYGTMWCHDNYVNVRILNQARGIKDHLKGILEKVGLELKSCLNDLEAVKKAITAGFFPHSAARLQKSGSSYRTIGKHPQTVDLDPSSYFAQMQSPPKGWVIYHELVSTTNNKYITLVTELKPEWLLEVAPHYYQLSNTVVQTNCLVKMDGLPLS